MSTAFTKMHGLGNDFVVVRGDGRPLPDPARVRALACRRTGIGFDQLLWLEPPRQAGAAVFYRVVNSDGSTAEQCGNGARCIARFLAGPAAQGEVVLEHGGGLSPAKLLADGRVSISMGEPRFAPADIPFVAPAPAEHYAVDAGAESVELRVVSMGNPHGVLRVADVDSAPVARLGPLLERHERFPNRANIGFVQVVDRGHARLRVYERGAGETRACGTGACAAMVVGQRAGWFGSDVQLQLPGGQLDVSWQGPGTPVWLTGEAVTVFEGTVEL